MSKEISRFTDVSTIGSDFDTGTLCGRVELEERNGTPKCFTINPVPGRPGGMVIMPKLQALLLAGQIANEFGYELRKKDV